MWRQRVQFPMVRLVLSLLLLLCAITSPVRANSEVEPFRVAPEDELSVTSLFSLRQEQHASKNWVLLAGLGTSRPDTPDTLALVYEIDSTSWFGATARLLLVGKALPSALVEGNERLSDGSVAFMELARLTAPFEDNRIYRVTFGYSRQLDEVSVSVTNVESNQPVYEGYLSVSLPQKDLYVGLDKMLTVNGSGNDLTIMQQKVSWHPGVYTRLGPSVSLKYLHWYITAQSAGKPVRETSSFRFGDSETIGIHVDWPQLPLTGQLILTVENTAVRDVDTSDNDANEITRLPWSKEPVDVNLDNLLPLGSYEIVLSYVDGANSYSLGKEHIEIIRGIKSNTLVVPTEIWSTDPVAASLRIGTDRTLRDVDVEIVGTRVRGQPSNTVGNTGTTTMTLFRTRIAELHPGDNVIPFTITSPELGVPGEITLQMFIWGVRQEGLHKVIIRNGWVQNGLELVGVSQATFQRLGWYADKPTGLDFVLSNKGSQPVTGTIEATLTNTDSQSMTAASVMVPVSQTNFQLAPGEKTTFSLGAIPKYIVGWQRLQVVVKSPNDLGATFAIGTFYTGLLERADKDLQLVDNTLYISGKPTFVRGMGFYDFTLRNPAEWERDLHRYADWGMNLVEVFVLPGTGPAFGQFLTAAQKAGVYVVGDIHWRRIWELDWNERYQALIPFLAYWDQPNLLAWVLRDDSMYLSHYLELLKMRDFIRQYDKSTLITTTILDLRRQLDASQNNNGLNAAQLANYQALLDFPTPYEYPVLRKAGGTFAPMYATKGGLDVVQELARRTQVAWRDPDQYMWTWVQAHSQRDTIAKLDFAYNESYTSTPDQLRLLTYEMIAAGVNGLLYYRDYFFEDLHYGMGRRHELDLMWKELSKVEPLLAAGQRETLLAPNGDGVEAVQFSLGSEKAVLLVQHHFDDVRYVGTGLNEPMQLRIPGNDNGSKAYQISPLGVTELPATRQEDGLVVQVPTFDLTATLLVTSNAQRIAEITAACQKEAPHTARSALFVLADTLAKVEAVSQLIPALPSTEPTLAKSKDSYAGALTHYAAGEWAAAYSEANAAREPLRLLAKAQLARAEQNGQQGPKRYLESYFSLPKFYGHTDPLTKVMDEKLAQVLIPLGGPEWPGVRDWGD